MKRQTLSGEWRLEIPGSGFPAVRATVPGSVYSDLLSAGLIPDPFDRDNEDEALKIMEYDFIYSRNFRVSPELLAADAVLLRCHGLDTLATVELNGRAAGKADNMHRTWEFDVRGLLREGENTIRVTLASPTRFIREAYDRKPLEGSSDAMRGFPYLRKAHCMFGWDWGPHLPDAGIWREIELLGVEKARLGDVVVLQHHGPDRVTLEISARAERFAKGGTPGTVRGAAPEDGTLSVSVRVTSPEGAALTTEGKASAGPAPAESLFIGIDHPNLWWPAGYGDQPLYTLEVTLRDGERVLDVWRKRIGLRTLTVRREKDQWGESFCHRVNGLDVFAMGADYIPEDNLLPRVTRERTRRLLEDARAAHMNTIRVWGGGYYPGEDFYDLCDELGLLVWQDFMFACASYDLTEAFEENVRAEVRDNLRRIRHHASLALLCGNNEMESFVPGKLFAKSEREIADYIKLFEYILPRLVREEAPETFYWPSSPSSGGSFDAPGDENRGDCHYWDVWHGLKPFTDYRNHLFRYASEFGFQSFPCMATIESFTRPEDRNVFSYVMEKHQRNASANGKIAEYLSQTYLYPSTFDAFVYASQLLQAQAMQYGVEHWRRHRGRCMGTLVWQLNDCWPVTSWASIDYFGRWKALHYYEKRFFAPVLISCEEEGTLTQKPNVNAEPFPLRKSARLNVCNESREPFRGRIRWSLRSPDAAVLEEGRLPVEAPPLSALWLDRLDFPDRDPYGCYFAYELEDEAGTPVGGGTVLFCAPKHFRFRDPGLTVRMEGQEILVTARAYARSVEIRCNPDALLEDNFFDMNGGTRRIRVLRGDPGPLSVRSVYDIR